MNVYLLSRSLMFVESVSTTFGEEPDTIESV